MTEYDKALLAIGALKRDVRHLLEYIRRISESDDIITAKGIALAVLNVYKEII